MEIRLVTGLFMNVLLVLISVMFGTVCCGLLARLVTFNVIVFVVNEEILLVVGIYLVRNESLFNYLVICY